MMVASTKNLGLTLSRTGTSDLDVVFTSALAANSLGFPRFWAGGTLTGESRRCPFFTRFFKIDVFVCVVLDVFLYSVLICFPLCP